MSPRIFLAKCPPIEHMPVDFDLELAILRGELKRGAPVPDQGDWMRGVLSRAVRNGSKPSLWPRNHSPESYGVSPSIIGEPKSPHQG